MKLFILRIINKLLFYIFNYENYKYLIFNFYKYIIKLRYFHGDWGLGIGDWGLGGGGLGG